MIQPALAEALRYEHSLGDQIGEWVYVSESAHDNGKPFGVRVSHLYQEVGDAPVQVHQVHLVYDGTPEARTAAPHQIVRAIHSERGLTLDPGVRCECGTVGYVRGGTWVPRGSVGEDMPMVDGSKPLS
jgi:hypothetical protein